jgi:hypothetical protein
MHNGPWTMLVNWQLSREGQLMSAPRVSLTRSRDLSLSILDVSWVSSHYGSERFCEQEAAETSSKSHVARREKKALS